MDCLGLAKISEETAKDKALTEICNIIKRGQTWIPKTSDAKVIRFLSILPEITITGNGILLKGERIILPEKLHQKAIELAQW